MEFMLFSSLWIILWWCCWLWCRLDRHCSKQQLDVWNSSPDTAVLCASQRGVRGANQGERKFFLNYYLKKPWYLISVQSECGKPFHLKQCFQTLLEIQPGNLASVGPLDLFPVGFTSIWGQKVQNPPRRSSRVLHVVSGQREHEPIFLSGRQEMPK